MYLVFGFALILQVLYAMVLIKLLWCGGGCLLGCLLLRFGLRVGF